MQEEKLTTPVTEEERHQTISILEPEENSDTANSIEFIKDRKYWIILVAVVLATLVMLYLILYYIPSNYINNVMSSYNNNSTLAGIYVTIASNLLIAFVTFLYVLLTASLVIQSREAITKSNESIEQSKKEQQIRDIENRLEKFYLPAIDIIKENKHEPYNVYSGYRENIGSAKDPEYKKSKGFNNIKQYRYLAKAGTLEKFESILETEGSLRYGDTFRKEIELLNKSLENDIKDYTEKLKDLKK